MVLDVYLEALEERFYRYFDVFKEYTFRDERFEIMAKSLVRNERYIASKKVSIYAFENHEYCLIKYVAQLNEINLNEYIRTFQHAATELVNPHDEHMCTVITGAIIIDEPISEEIKKRIQRFKYNKSFALGLKGWTYVRLVVVQLKNGEVVTNRRGKEVRQFYEMNSLEEG